MNRIAFVNGCSDTVTNPSLTYHDNESVDYTYDPAGYLSTVGGYAGFDEYNALGQPGKAHYGNGIITSYW